MYTLSLACSSNSLPPSYLKFHPNLVGYSPKFVQFCWLFTPNFVGYLPPILSVIYPQFCGLFTPNRVGNLPPFLWVMYPNLWVMYPQFSGNLPQVWDSLLTPNFGNLGVNNESNDWGVNLRIPLGNLGFTPNCWTRYLPPISKIGG